MISSSTAGSLREALGNISEDNEYIPNASRGSSEDVSEMPAADLLGRCLIQVLSHVLAPTLFIAAC